MAWFEADAEAGDDQAPAVPPDLPWMQAELDEARLPAS
jgi:hypothetical protein